MNYEEMSDQQINLKIVKIIYGDINHDRDIKELWYKDRFNYCNDPKNWGKLMEDNKIGLNWWPEEDIEPSYWGAHTGNRYCTSNHNDKPGRCVAIAYLKMMDENNG